MDKIILLFYGAAITLTAQSVTTIGNFNGANGQGPSGPLLQAADGNYYGVAGGGAGFGTIYRLNSDGTITSLHTFSGIDGNSPLGSLIQDAAGNFYGITASGGTGGGHFGYGTVFKLTPNGTLTTLHSFTNTDGSSPNGLILAKDGTFYGTTSVGGSGDYGCVFKLTSFGTLTVLHSFTSQGDDGAYPIGLVQTGDGTFYGVTGLGGTHNAGTIFKVVPAGVTSTIYSFSGPGGTSPSGPTGPLIVASDGNLYGVTGQGGSTNNGCVFKFTPSGMMTILQSLSTSQAAGTLLEATDGNFYGVIKSGGAYGGGGIFKIGRNGAFTSIHSFASENGSGYDPTAALIQGTDGNLYGVTPYGGAAGIGTIFKVILAAASGPPTATTGLASSVSDTSATLSASINADGADTEAWFTFSKNGTSDSFSTRHQTVGSALGAITVVQPIAVNYLSPNTTYNFQAWASNRYGTVSGSVGSFTTAVYYAYVISGTVSVSGVGLGGVEITFTGTNQFSTTTDSAGKYSFACPSGNNCTVTPVANGYTFVPPSLSFTSPHADQVANFVALPTAPIAIPTTIASFTGRNGANPRGGIIQAKDGNFYGTTSAGGAGNLGTVFQVTPSGVITTLHSFSGTDGANPRGGLLEVAGGLYGTTSMGGPANAGTIYKISPAGAFATIENFGRNSLSEFPSDSLIQASDGDLYGSARGDGFFYPAIVFRLTTDGALTTLFNFGATLRPPSDLRQGSDGNFYVAHDGLIFSITPSGSLKTVYPICSLTVCTAAPIAPVQAADGSFYGTSSYSGANNSGAIYKVTPDGEFTVVHSFTFADGFIPNGLLLASDGNFYGTTAGGGAAERGTIFRFTPGGTFTTLHSFTPTEGGFPSGPLIQGSDRALYGTTSGVGDENGTVFRLPLPSLTPTILPASGIVSGASFQPGIAPNSWFTIIGTNLSETTDSWDNAIANGVLPPSLDGVTVLVGGKPAYIAYLSPGQINALAPDIFAGNVNVTVTNNFGSAASVAVSAQTFLPAFFLWGGYPVATRTDYSPAAKNGAIPGQTTVPAKAGETIILWGTGFGATVPAAPIGTLVPSGVTYNTANPVTVTIGEVQANVVGAALTPGAAGLYQIAIQIPNLPDGDYPVVATISGVQSPHNVLFTIQH